MSIERDGCVRDWMGGSGACVARALGRTDLRPWCDAVLTDALSCEGKCVASIESAGASFTVGTLELRSRVRLWPCKPILTIFHGHW